MLRVWAIRHRQRAVQHLPGGIGDVQKVIDQSTPARQGQADTFGGVPDAGALQG